MTRLQEVFARQDKLYRVRYLPRYRFVVYTLNQHEHSFHKDTEVKDTARRVLKALESKV